MMWVWERLIWRRTSSLQIELPQHGPSFETLVKLLAKNRVFIIDVDVDRLSSFLSSQPGVFTHKPARVTVVLRTRDRRHEEQFLSSLISLGYTYDLASAPAGDIR
ncbi:MAG: hypothetical protein WDN23_04385 [Edaphobacter sp.]